ncbi:hypothetical protein [Sphaerimonospora thailandensis]|uniref:Uncharacterized protein n=1 Tax=Sphaerimonospora thailandensis TaxID=795644 RepID=A0A8J3R587_9ACTN|nr:hypothetical protein [Sphaerimonospora thailandensis]GIH69461.1 hypothetical protein Mth01_17140 [Sphaerimonospora thailandensis]
MANPPLMVIPMPAPATLVAHAIETAAAHWAERGQVLTTGHLLNEETGYGPALVIPAPEPPDETGLVVVPADDLRHAIELLADGADTCGLPECGGSICQVITRLNAALEGDRG